VPVPLASLGSPARGQDAEISVTSMQTKGSLLEEAILPFISSVSMASLGDQATNARTSKGHGSLAFFGPEGRNEKRGPQIEVKVTGPEGPGIIPSAKLVLMKDLLSAQATLTNVSSSSLGEQAMPEPVLSKNNSYSIDATLLHYDFQSSTFLAPLPALSLDTSGITKIQEGKNDDLSTATFGLKNQEGEEQLTSGLSGPSFMPCFGLSRDYSFQEESYED
jgi:hypothetical protein